MNPTEQRLTKMRILVDDPHKENVTIGDIIIKLSYLTNDLHKLEIMDNDTSSARVLREIIEIEKMVVDFKNRIKGIRKEMKNRKIAARAAGKKMQNTTPGEAFSDDLEKDILG